MKFTKTSLAIVSIILLQFLVLHITVGATSSGTYGKYLSYDKTQGKIRITICHTMASDDFSIPTRIDGIDVGFIGDGAFKSCNRITSISIPNTVIEIGSNAFLNCTALTSISIPDKVTSIKYSTFQGCSKIEYIQLNNVEYIGSDAFGGCSSLASIIIPDSVKSIGSCAFAGCTKLKDVYITDLTKWCNIYFSGGGSSNPLCNGGNLYLNDSLITNLVIPDDVTEISNYNFYGCTGIETVSIPYGVTVIGGSAFENCYNLKNISIPDSITGIYADAFYNCNNLTNLIIPKSVTTIGDFAFEGCDSLKLRCYANSYGYEYAVDNGLNYSVICDVSGDDAVNAKDLTALRKYYLLGETVTDEADCNGDDFVDIRDLVHLKKVLAEMA